MGMKPARTLGTSRLLALTLLGLLTACNQTGSAPITPTPTTPSGTAASTSSYSILSVLPTPAAPGMSVTAYGQFPKGASSVALNTTTLAATPVQDGLQFTLPGSLLAGTFSVSVPGASGTPGTLEVRPKLDSLSLSASVLTVRGAGWGAAPLDASVSVRVGSRSYAPTLTPAGLQVTLAGPLGNGSFPVQLGVGGLLSNTLSFTREAGHLSGQLLRPIAGQALQAQAIRPAASVPFTRLLVPAGTPVPSGVTAQPLPALGLLQLRYPSAGAAHTALNVFTSQGISAQPDAPLHLDGSVAVQDASPIPSRQWFWPLMSLPQGWSRARGAGVTVAVIDTGILLSHPAFAGRILPGYNVVDGNDQVNDTAGHGTHVAGLVAAQLNAPLGVNVTGAAPEASLLPVKVLKDLSDGTVSDLAQGILWAVDALPGHPNPHPAQVLNISLGTSDQSELLASAVRTAQAKGALLVVANGNDGGPLYYPAALPGVLAVTSVSGPTLTYQPAYANRGPGTRIAGYGGDQGSDQDGNGVTDGILSTDIDAQGKPAYAYRQGTSMATPEVSGLAALALSAGTPPALLKATLEQHASDTGFQGFDEQTGWGVANADPARADSAPQYVVVQDAAGKLLNWTTAVSDRYTLTNLPPDSEVTLTAYRDSNNNGVLGEPGELGSQPVKLKVGNASSSTQDLSLNPLDGTHPLTLSAPAE